MKKPWNSNKAWGQAWVLPTVLAWLFLFPAICSGKPVLPSPVVKADAALWRQSEALADRLIEERRKIDGFLNEVGKLVMTCEDLRDMQLYPNSVTRLSRGDDVEFDKSIEGLEKAIAKTRESIGALEAGLGDAVFIAGEMADVSLNRDMLDLLHRDNLRRVARLIDLQKTLDKRWDEATALLETYRKRSGIEAMRAPKEDVEGDFFRVLQNSVGLSSERFYQAFHAYKDSLVLRGGRKEWELMAKVDLERLQGRMSTRVIERVRQDLKALRSRFDGKMPIGVIEFALGASTLAGGKPMEAAQIFAAVKSDSKMHGQARLGVVQAYFAAQEDDSVVVAFERYSADASLQGGILASARYLAVQSLYALGRDSLVERAALQSLPAEAWHAKTLLVLARSLVRQKRHAEARGILGKLSGDPRQSQNVRDQAAMALAHLHFEDRYHEAALKGYRDLLDREGFQAEALYGMVWCNIRLGDLDGAEFILKKLISQHPDNVWAMEGFMVLVRKMLRKAQVEWDWQKQHSQEMHKIDELARKLSGGAPGISEESAARLTERMDSARKVLRKNPPMSAENIANLYQQALNLCDFLESRYRSGEYSEKTFRSDRERVLARLRLAATPFSADSALTLDPKPDARKLILAKLFEAKSLSLDIHVMHRGWLGELLRHWQIKLRHEIDSLPQTDSGLAQRQEIEKQSRRLADDIGERIAARSEDILNRINELFEDPNAASIQDWMLFQRGYLLYVREEENLRRSLAARRWVRNSAGGVSALTDEPEVDYRVYESPWHDLLRRHPQSPYAPAALYYLGYSMTSRGEGDRGLTYFETLAERFPQSTYAQQSLIFIGEHYFTENKLDKAEAAYDKVLDFPESRYFDQALYKLAWTRYRRNSYKSAISSFSYILEESLRKEGEKKGLLAGEALQYTALSLAEADTSGEGGWKDGMQFADRFGNARVGAELLHKMALIYLQQNRLERAKRAMESLMKAYPDYAKIPEVLMDLAQAYDKGQEFEQGSELRERVFRAYLPGTPAYAAVSSPNRRRELDTLVENAGAFVSRHHLFEARKLATSAATGAKADRDRRYRKALSVLEAWQTAYPKDARVPKNLYQQAEIHYALAEFKEAARKYMQVSRLDRGALKMTAAYNAIVAAQELQRLAPPKNKPDSGDEP